MIGKLFMIVIDTPDPRGLAAFYQRLTGWEDRHDSDDWVTKTTPEGWNVAFQLAPDHVPPQWPDQKHPQQAHLDFLVGDRAASVAKAIELGAVQLPGGGETWTVLADPSGHPFCLCDSDDASGVRLVDYGLDVPDGKAVAKFYSELLSLPVTYEGAEGAAVGEEGELTVMFQNVEDYRAPQWPDPAHPQQFHLDVLVSDVDEAERKVLALGATKLPGGGGTESGYRVFADPVGHPFCLVWGQ